MTTRILPVEEWPRLAGTEAEMVWPALDPKTSTILVVEQGGQIVGCHVLFYLLHAECLWIRPDLRGRSTVARRLWGAVQRFAKTSGVRALITAACDDRVRGLIAHVGGTQLPGEHYVIPVGR